MDESNEVAMQGPGPRPGAFRSVMVQVALLALLFSLSACHIKGLGPDGRAATLDETGRPVDLGVYGIERACPSNTKSLSAGALPAAGHNYVQVVAVDLHDYFCFEVADSRVGLALPIDGRHATTAWTRSGDLIFGLVDPLVQTLEVMVDGEFFTLETLSDGVPSPPDGGLMDMVNAKFFAVQLDDYSGPVLLRALSDSGELEVITVDVSMTSTAPGRYQKPAVCKISSRLALPVVVDDFAGTGTTATFGTLPQVDGQPAALCLKVKGPHGTSVADAVLGGAHLGHFGCITLGTTEFGWGTVGPEVGSVRNGYWGSEDDIVHDDQFVEIYPDVRAFLIPIDNYGMATAMAYREARPTPESASPLAFRMGKAEC